MHLTLSYCAFSMQCNGLGRTQACFCSEHKVNTGLPHVLGELLPCHFPFHLSSFIVYSCMLNQFVAKLVGTLCACTFCQGNYTAFLKSCNFWFDLLVTFTLLFSWRVPKLGNQSDAISQCYCHMVPPRLFNLNLNELSPIISVSNFRK